MRKRWMGFTLVEMLVVIAIIGVLAGLILPSVGRARKQAWTKRCAANLRQLHTGMMTYASEHSYYCIGACYIDQYDQEHNAWIYWKDRDNQQYSYLGTAGEENIRKGLLWGYMGGQIAVYACPTHVSEAEKNGSDVVRSYAMCADLCGTSGTGGPKVLTLRDASKKIMFGEVTEARMKLSSGKLGSFCTTNDFEYSTHGGKANVIYVDGHQAQLVGP